MYKAVRGSFVAGMLIAWGCSSSSISGTGGVTGTGGVNGAALGGTVDNGCESGSSCGGDVVGAWTVASSCLSLNGLLDLSLLTLGCSSATVSGVMDLVGTMTMRADRSYVDETTIMGTLRFKLAQSCLAISSTPVQCAGAAKHLMSVGFSALTCDPAMGGGCDCVGTVNHKGGLALLSPSPNTSGQYFTVGGTLTASGDVVDSTWGYCVSGSDLSLSPRTGSQVVKGHIRLRRNGDVGAGATGGAGERPAGGAGGVGGTTTGPAAVKGAGTSPSAPARGPLAAGRPT